MLFKCPHCNYKEMELVRFLDNAPIGICGHCESVTEFNEGEEIMAKITGWKCDMPGCPGTMSESTGGKFMYQSVARMDASLATSPDKFIKEMELCDEDFGLIDEIFRDEAVMAFVISRLKRRVAGQDAAETRKARRDGNPDRDTVVS